MKIPVVFSDSWKNEARKEGRERSPPCHEIPKTALEKRLGFEEGDIPRYKVFLLSI